MKKIKEKIFRMGLRQKTLTFAMLFFLLAVIISGLAFYSIYRNMRQETMDKVLENFAVQKKTEIQDYFDNLEITAYEIGFSSWMQMLFERNDRNEDTFSDLEESFEYYLGNISQMIGGIRLAAIMKDGSRMKGSDGTYLDYSIQIEKMDWYPEFEKTGKYIEIGNGKGIYTRDVGWYMNIYYPINNQYSLEQEGVLVITLLEENVKEFTKARTSGEYILLEDEEGHVIASGLPEEIRLNLEEQGSNYKIRTEKIDIGGQVWEMTAVLDTENLKIENREIWIGFIVTLVLLTSLFAAGAILFSEYLTIPILKCRDTMMKIRNNQIGVYMENPYDDELGELIDGFNEMSSSIAGLIEKNKTISTLQKETEYQMLQQQINPHFLYNTLEIINGLILCGKDMEAVDVCENLGQIFRYNLNQNKWITVKEEIRYLKQYLMIMKYKIPDLFVDWEIGENVENAKILKAILQPAVENAIKHGFRDKREECCISFEIKKEDEELLISIMDNGSGMSREKYIEILKKLQTIRENPNVKREESVHIGIQNIFHRLYLEYGEDMDFQIITKKNLGTKIQIEIPEEEDYV